MGRPKRKDKIKYKHYRSLRIMRRKIFFLTGFVLCLFIFFILQFKYDPSLLCLNIELCIHVFHCHLWRRCFFVSAMDPKWAYFNAVFIFDDRSRRQSSKTWDFGQKLSVKKCTRPLPTPVFREKSRALRELHIKLNFRIKKSTYVSQWNFDLKW